ncbi:MAG: MFS transporter [Alphaproteobacteria bacterium]|nr:MFS transporter [Alphaproteobacteria bacterium]
MSPAAAATQSPMRHRPFLLFWCARVASTVAFQMQAVAIGWQLYDLTQDPLDLGLVGLVQFVPVVALSLLVGHVADRYDRRVVIRACFAVEAVAAALLTAGSAGQWLEREAILSLVFVVGVCRAFELPSMQALVPALVPGPLLSRAVAASTSANQTAIIAGPALGGVLYVAGAGVVYACCAALFAVASALAAAIRIDRPPAHRATPGLASLFVGFTYIRGRPVLLGVVSLDLFAVLLGAATALLPIYARDVLATGPWGLGILRSAPAVGALATAVVLARRPLQRRAGRIMFAAVVGFGAATVVFALSTSLLLSVAALVTLGACDAVSVVIRLSLVQIETPDEMRGRVSAVNAMFIGTSNTLGDFRAGLAAAWLGVVPAVAIGGIGTLLVALLWMRLFPDLARLERLEPGRG